MKIGIFGGTFDPCHCGHYEIVRTVLKKNLVDRIIVVPTIVDYYRKDKKPLFNYDERLKILNKWFGNLDNVIVDDVEYEMEKKYIIASKTCEYEMSPLNRRYWHMLCDLKRKYGVENEYYSIIGEDSWNNLDSWYNSEQLMKESKFIVVERDEKKRKLYERGAEFITIDEKFSKISATEIRERLNDDRIWRKDKSFKPDDFLSMYLEDVEDYLKYGQTYDEIQEELDHQYCHLEKSKEDWNKALGKITKQCDVEKLKKNTKKTLDILKNRKSMDEDKDKDCSFKYSELEYESLRDKALEMQYVLKNIEKELHECAICGGKSENGYSYEDCHAKLCQIMFGSMGYHKEKL